MYFFPLRARAHDYNFLLAFLGADGSGATGNAQGQVRPQGLGNADRGNTLFEWTFVEMTVTLQGIYVSNPAKATAGSGQWNTTSLISMWTLKWFAPYLLDSDVRHRRLLPTLGSQTMLCNTSPNVLKLPINTPKSSRPLRSILDAHHPNFHTLPFLKSGRIYIRLSFRPWIGIRL